METSFGQAAKTIANVVRESTEGRVVVDIYPNATLGNDAAMLASTAAGSLDLTLPSSALLERLAPEIGLLDMPFLFENRAHAHAALDGPEGVAMAAAVTAKGVTVLAWGENGVRHMTANRPLRQAADLRGLKLRVLPAAILIDAFRAMGAQAQTIPYSELYEALSTGRFEAEENPLQLVLNGRFFEVQSHVTLTAHTYSAMGIVASPDLIDDLSAADGAVLRKAAGMAALRSREFAEQTSASAMAALRAKGMIIIDDPDRRSYIEATAPAEAAAAKRFGGDLISRLRAA